MLVGGRSTGGRNARGEVAVHLRGRSALPSGGRNSRNALKPPKMFAAYVLAPLG